MNYSEIFTLQTKLIKRANNFTSSDNCSILTFTLKNGLQCCIRFISSKEENNYIANLDLHSSEGVFGKFESIDNIQNLFDIIELLEKETYQSKNNINNTASGNPAQKQAKMQTTQTPVYLDSEAEKYLDNMEEINSDGTKVSTKPKPQKQPQKTTPVQPNSQKVESVEYDYEYDHDYQVKKPRKKFRKRRFNKKARNIKGTIIISIFVIAVVFALFLCFAGIKSCMTKRESVTRDFSASIDTSLGTIYLTPGKTYQLSDGNYEFSDSTIFDKDGEKGMIVQNAAAGEQVQVTVSGSINGKYDGIYTIEFVSYPIDEFIFPQDLQ